MQRRPVRPLSSASFLREPQVTAEPKFIQIGVPLVHASLDNGETVWVVARETEFDRVIIPSEDRWSRNLRVADKKASTKVWS